MKLGTTVFDDGPTTSEMFAFSANKGKNYAPPIGFLEALTVSPDGSCTRTCVESPCSCLDPDENGDCPGDDCWGPGTDSEGRTGLQRCQCWDAYAFDFGRCTTGKFCQEGCDDCCNAGRPGMTCMKDYRDNYLNSGDGNTYLEFVEDEACPATGLLGTLETGSGTEGNSNPPPAPVCCPKGTCRYSREASTFGYYYYCLSGVSEAVCSSLKKDSKNMGVTFTCCPTGASTCDCEKTECPEGEPERACTSSEVWTHVEGSFGQVDQCYCNCRSSFKIDTVELGNLCIVCGENSTWNKSSQKCKCKDDYETPSGTDGFGLTELTVDSNGVEPDDHKTATGQPCVPKKYKCDQTKDPPECVYVPVAQRDGIENDLYDLKTGCEGAGCGKYKCESGECVHDMTSTEFANKQACLDSTCRNHKCINEECVPDVSGLHVGEKACLDAGCGGKWFCNASAECIQVSLVPPNPMPDGAREFDKKEDCEASCGKYYCDTGGSCKQFKQGQESETSNTLLFADETACSSGNCGKYYCDDEANLCRKAGGMDAQGKAQYWVELAECTPSCSCPGQAQPGLGGWAGEFAVDCSAPDAGSPCSQYSAFMDCIKAKCISKYGLCKETNTGAYIECSGGSLACIEAKTYQEDTEKLAQGVSACRTQTYWFLYSAGGPYEISDCVTESYKQAIQFGHSNIKVGGECTEPEQSEWVAPTQTFTNKETGNDQYYPRPSDPGDYLYMTYRPC